MPAQTIGYFKPNAVMNAVARGVGIAARVDCAATGLAPAPSAAAAAACLMNARRSEFIGSDRDYTYPAHLTYLTYWSYSYLSASIASISVARRAGA